MKKAKEIKAVGFCIVRKDLQKSETGVPIGHYHFCGSRPLPYRWLNDDEGFQVFYQNNWQDAESIDFDYLKDEKDIIVNHFISHGYSEAMEEIKQWSAKELKDVVRFCGYRHTYSKDILIDMVQDLARMFAWKLTMEKPNPFLVKTEFEINYKEECLKINSKLKVLKEHGRHWVATGNLKNHTLYSAFTDSPSEAWKSCYQRFTKPHVK